MRRTPLWQPNFVPPDAWARAVFISMSTDDIIRKIHALEPRRGRVFMPGQIARMAGLEIGVLTERCAEEFRSFAFKNFPEELELEGQSCRMREIPDEWSSFAWVGAEPHTAAIMACYHEFDLAVRRAGLEVIRRENRGKNELGSAISRIGGM